MARSSRSGTTVEVVRRTQRFFWPLPLLNGWLLFMMACGVTMITVFALNVNQQHTLELGIPWLFPFGITVGALTIALVIIVNVLMISNNIIPGLMIMLSALFFALYMTGTVETGLQLFGPGIVNDACRNHVINQDVKGFTVAALAWLELNSICTGWFVAFTFWLVGAAALLFMIFVSLSVNRAQLDTEETF